MKITAPKTVIDGEGVNSTMAKTHSEKVVGKLGKKPKTATTVAQQLGLPSHHGVARALGQAVKDGKAVKTDKGYTRAE